jgi:mannitol-specific phosphotransferase system IIBC component
MLSRLNRYRLAINEKMKAFARSRVARTIMSLAYGAGTAVGVDQACEYIDNKEWFDVKDYIKYSATLVSFLVVMLIYYDDSRTNQKRMKNLEDRLREAKDEITYLREKEEKQTALNQCLLSTNASVIKTLKHFANGEGAALMDEAKVADRLFTETMAFHKEIEEEQFELVVISDVIRQQEEDAKEENIKEEDFKDEEAKNNWSRPLLLHMRN